MLPALPLPQTLDLFLATLALAAASVWLLSRARPAGRRARFARAAVAAIAALAAAPAAGMLLWSSGRGAEAALGVRLAWTSLVVLCPATLGLFVTSLLAAAIAALRPPARPRPAPPPSAAPAVSRRALVRASLSILPASAAGAGVGGLASAPDAPRVPLVKMRFRDLPPDLDGLRILHLSDLHLGVARHVEDLEALLARVAPLAPDLIVLTGDVADHLGQLEAALEALDRYRPRLGIFASLGNHEYLADIERTRPIYEASRVQLLVDRGATIEAGRARIYVAGADDPVVWDRDRVAAFLERSVARCSAEAPEDAFRLLLCHRPEGFAPAARRGFHLTLAGHTHGGQVGLFGRSAFQALFPDLHLWGAYRRGESRLYTTSGFGHWFPFRLGCPTEAPIIELVREHG
ncbi:metallophosphoesterase [Sorangium sp. So ce341]|uniref:metallophosphoesterase n=1 Tax=Sorangium sp. So ce341 TaxID=3133302 RepID=UPI003F5E38BA